MIGFWLTALHMAAEAERGRMYGTVPFPLPYRKFPSATNWRHEELELANETCAWSKGAAQPNSVIAANSGQ